jgi:hypothetical protein
MIPPRTRSRNVRSSVPLNSTVDDVWAVPEIKTRFFGSHVDSAILKSENLADPAAVPF